MARAFVRVTPFVLGTVLAAFVIGWWLQTLSHWGASLEFVCGLLMAAGMAVAFAFHRRVETSSPRAQGVMWLLVAAWSVLLPTFAKALTAPLSLVPIHWLEIPSFEFLIGLVAGGVLLSVPHYGVARLLQRSLTGQTLPLPNGANVTTRWCVASLNVSGLGAAAGMLLWPTVVLPWGDALILSGCASLIAILVGGVLVGAPVRVLSLMPWVATGVGSTAQPLPNELAKGTPKSLPIRLGIAATVGMVLVLVVRLQSQLWLAGMYGPFAVFGGLIAGMMWGRLRKKQDSLPIAATLAGVSAAVMVGGFDWLVYGTLWFNANVSHVVSLMISRAALCGLLAFPAGWALGLIQPERRLAKAAETDSLLCLACVTGALVMRWWMPSLAVACLIVVSCSIAMVVPLMLTARTGSAGSPAAWTWRRTMGWSAAAGLAIVGVVRMDSCTPSHSARLLFSTQTNIAARTSSEKHLLTALDDGRLVNCHEGRSAVWTLWKHRGEMLVLRENGLPVSGLSLDPGITPQVSAEVMAAALPLAVHPRPDRVLVVGLGGTATVAACLEFPVHQVTCFEADEELSQVLESHLQTVRSPVLSDNRVTMRMVSPALASGCSGMGPFDVIVLNHSQPASLRTLGTESLEGFRRWSRLMTDDGVFCQRLSFVDLGSQPVRDAVRTLAAVFPQVIMWESAPGEVLLLATRSEKPLVDEGLMDRLSSPHARRVLAQIDWDWSMPLSFMATRSEAVAEMIGSEARTNSAATARAACRLPTEVARWGNKWDEVRQLIQPHVTPVVSWLEPSHEVEEVHKRLADIAEQRTIINSHPDHFWAYRNKIRERLQDRPRSKIVQVAHEGLKRELDPEDERRKAYLEALGSVATDESPDRELLERVTSFIAPYDPLVAPFLPGEVARLYSRSEPRNSRMELRLWLRSVYYAPPFDRSVRGAVAALNLMIEHPEAVDQASSRWDHTNALLEILKQRWIARSQASTGSRFDPVDARETIDAANRAMQMLRDTASEAGIDPAWCDARCQVLERTLVRPLRSHQARQVERIKKIDQQMEAQQRSGAETVAAEAPAVTQ